jgi:GNAT superfamily N-acetyltransferase
MSRSGSEACHPGRTEHTMICAVRVTRHAVRRELPTVVDILSEAFDEDPVMAWMVEDRDARVGMIRSFFDIVATAAFEHGHVYLHDGGAATIWSPPDVEIFDEATGNAVVDLMRRCIDDEEHLGRILEGFVGFSAGHPHDPPHFYLMFIGSRPSVRGAGHGTTMLADMLARCDAQQLPAYLEASSDLNRPLYERHGFRTFETFEFPDGPPIWRMWRDPSGEPTY